MPRLRALLIGLTATCGLAGCTRGVPAPAPAPTTGTGTTTVQAIPDRVDATDASDASPATFESQEVALADGLAARIDLTSKRPFDAEFVGQPYPEGALYVTLNLIGDAIVNTYHYGEFELVDAEDSTGAILELAAPVVNGSHKEFGDGFVGVNDLFLDQYDTLPIHFVLTAPAEDAEELSNLELSVKLKLGSSVVMEDVVEHIGNTVFVDGIGEARISKWGGVGDDNPDNGILFDFSDSAGAVQRVSLLDGDGKRQRWYQSSVENGKFAFCMHKTLPEDIQIRVIRADSENIQVVPIRFKNIELKR